MTDRPSVSVVIPCRNEGDFIAPCLDSILANDYPRERLEVLVVDGMSDDGTRETIRRYAREHPWIRLLDNPRRITPCALNVGVAVARGGVIMRMDAHTNYPPHYIARLVEWLEESGADNVGAACVTLPANGTVRARAIAAALAHPFGVGNAYFRIGTTEPRWVDTVPFGCYRREVFDRIGPFDEELVRNQDDELNTRLLRAGGRILLVPNVTSSYYARDSFAKLWRMYYQYGYYKPLVVRKVRGVFTARQLVPAMFVLAVAAAGAAAPWSASARLALAGVLGAYGAAAAVAAGTTAVRRGAALWPALVAAFAILHVAYGVGFLRGVADFWVARRPRSRQAEVALSR